MGDNMISKSITNSVVTSTQLLQDNKILNVTPRQAVIEGLKDLLNELAEEHPGAELDISLDPALDPAGKLVIAEDGKELKYRHTQKIKNICKRILAEAQKQSPQKPKRGHAGSQAASPLRGRRLTFSPSSSRDGSRASSPDGTEGKRAGAGRPGSKQATPEKPKQAASSDQVQKAEAMVGQLTIQLATIGQERDQHIERARGLEESVQKAEAEIGHLRRELAAAEGRSQEQTDQARVRIAQLQEQLAAAIAGAEAAAKQLDEARLRIGDLEQGITQIQAEKAELRKQLNNSMFAAEQAKARLGQLELDLRGAQHTVGLKDNEIASIKNLQQRATADADRYHTQVGELEGRIGQLSDELNKLKGGLAESQGQGKADVQRLADAEARIKRLVAEMDALVQKAQAADTRSRTLESKLTEALRDKQALAGQVKTLSGQLTDAQAQGAALQRNLKQATTLSTSQAEQLRTMETAAKASDAVIAQLNATQEQLQGQLGELRAQAEQAAQRTQTLQTQLADASTAHTQDAAEIQTLTAALALAKNGEAQAAAQLQQAAKQATDQAQTMQAEIAAGKENIEQLTATQEQLQGQLGELTAQAGQATQLTQALQTQLAAASTAHTQDAAEIQTLTAALAAAKTGEAQATAQLQQATKQVTDQAEALQVAEHASKAKDAQIAQLTQAQEALKAEMAILTQAATDSTAQIQLLQGALKTARSAHTEADARAKQLTDENAALQAQLGKLVQEKAALQASLAQATGTIEQLRMDLAASQAADSAKAVRIQELEAALAIKEKELPKLNTTAAEANARVQKLLGELAASNRKKEEALEQVKTLTQQFADARSHNAHLDEVNKGLLTEMGQLKAALRQKTTALGQQTEACKALQAEVATLKGSEERLNAQIAQMQAAHTAALAEKDDMIGELQALAQNALVAKEAALSRVAQLDSELSSLSARLREAETERTRLRAENQELRDRLAAQDKTNDAAMRALQEQLAKLKAEHAALQHEHSLCHKKVEPVEHKNEVGAGAGAPVVPPVQFADVAHAVRRYLDIKADFNVNDKELNKLASYLPPSQSRHFVGASKTSGHLQNLKAAIESRKIKEIKKELDVFLYSDKNESVTERRESRLMSIRGAIAYKLKGADKSDLPALHAACKAFNNFRSILIALKKSIDPKGDSEPLVAAFTNI